MYHYIKNIRNEIKWRWQRAIRGYADVDWQNLHYNCAVFICVSVEELINKSRSKPAGLSEEEWKAILIGIKEGFQAAIDIYDDNYDPMELAYLKEKHNRALDLFAYYYNELWS